jgi:hypothetical protein
MQDEYKKGMCRRGLITGLKFLDQTSRAGYACYFRDNDFLQNTSWRTEVEITYDSSQYSVIPRLGIRREVKRDLSLGCESAQFVKFINLLQNLL